MVTQKLKHNYNKPVYELVQRFPTFSCSRTPKEKKLKLLYPLVSCEKAFYNIFISKA